MDFRLTRRSAPVLSRCPCVTARAGSSPAMQMVAGLSGMIKGRSKSWPRCRQAELRKVNLPALCDARRCGQARRLHPNQETSDAGAHRPPEYSAEINDVFTDAANAVFLLSLADHRLSSF